jgi:hypothetical protein
MGAKPLNMPVNRAFFNMITICFNMVVMLFLRISSNFAAEKTILTQNEKK